MTRAVPPASAVTADVLRSLTGFARALRVAGVAADRARLTNAVEALDHLDLGNADQVYWATRMTLCSEPDDLDTFDTVFDFWFRGAKPATTTARPAPARTPTLLAVGPEPTAGDGEDGPDEDDVLPTAASENEVLRRRDVAALTDDERQQVNAMIGLLAPRVGRRPTRRRGPGGRDLLDVRRTVRAMLRDGGEPGRLVHARRRTKPRRLVLLLDVSGSMSPYAEVLLRFSHAAVRVAPSTTEVFTAGTRLTRVTRQLRLRDPDLALRAAGSAVPDWSGGTRLGDALRVFLDRWGQRGAARRAVVVIASDGWERGDAALLGEQMARLARLAHLVVWVNPHKGRAGFAPLTGGMLAAMPYVDALVSGHSFAALREVAEVIADA